VSEQRPRALLVEDDSSVRNVIDRQLHGLGWEVVAARTGREAIRLVKRGMVVDVLLTDLKLPDVDGITVARTVSRVLPGTRVVFMSGSAPAVALEPRDAPFLLKPFSKSALAEALEIANYPR